MSPVGIIVVFFAMAITVIGMILSNCYFHLWWRTKLEQACAYDLADGGVMEFGSPQGVEGYGHE